MKRKDTRKNRKGKAGSRKSGKGKRSYDQAFKSVIAIPVINASIIRLVHPDFHHFSIRELVQYAQKDHEELLTLRNEEIWQGGHVLHGDSVVQYCLPLPDQENMVPSRYLVNDEMQREQDLPYSLPKRSGMYAAGLAARGYHAKLYEYSPQVISVWLLPVRPGTLPRPPYYLPWSGNAQDLNRYLKNPKRWYTESREKRMQAGRNTASQAVCFVEFDGETDNRTELQQLLCHLFYREKPDYRFLASRGIRLTSKEKKEVDVMYMTQVIMYEKGESSGIQKGIQKGIRTGRQESQALFAWLKRQGRRQDVEKALDFGPNYDRLLAEMRRKTAAGN